MILSAPVALTQTLAPFYYKKKANIQLEKTRHNLCKLLKNCCYFYEIQAELTEKCNIHYHGQVTFISEDHKLVYYDSVRDLGHCLIKPITNLKSWQDYCQKDTTKTLKLLNLERTSQIRFSYAITNESLVQQMAHYAQTYADTDVQEVLPSPDKEYIDIRDLLN